VVAAGFRALVPQPIRRSAVVTHEAVRALAKGFKIPPVSVLLLVNADLMSGE